MPSSRSKAKPLPDTPLHEWSFEAIGTQWWIGVYQLLADAELEQLKQTIADRIEQFDVTYSRFRADSLMTRISQKAGTYELPADGQMLFDWYRAMYDATDGAVTPLIGQTISDAGYDADYSFTTKSPSTPPDWDEVLSVHGTTLKTTQPVLLDVGAAGKGYLLDIIAQLLQQTGITSYCVDASGDLVCHGTAPLTIGLENPDNATQVIGVALLSNQALCASAGNKRTWGDYHHILNPKTLESPRHIKALWVIADDGLHADGLATALFFEPPKKLAKLCSFEYLIVHEDGSVSQSPDFPAQLFTS